MNANLIYAFIVVAVLTVVGFVGYRTGANSVRVEYQERDAAAQRKYSDDLAKAISERDTAIRLHNEAQTAASTQYQTLTREKKDAEEKAARAVATGTRKLYVLAKCPSANGSGALPQAPADPNGPSASVRIELEPAVGADIKRFGNRINQLQRDYNYCYATLENDRK
jgi:hypothetical protein